jgi:hypothetical protein
VPEVGAALETGIGGLVTQLLGVIVGWALGIGSHFIIDTIRRRKEEQEIRAALKVEMGEIEYRMAIAAFHIDSLLGALGRETLELIRPIIARYEGANYDRNLLGSIDAILGMPDEHVVGLGEASKLNAATTGIALQKYEVPYLDARVSALSLFDNNADLQSRLLEVRASLGLFNDLVEQSRFYSRLRFDSSLSEVNFEIVAKNLDLCYRNASQRAKVLLRHIGWIKW